jgi:hypothetical protein
MAERQEAWAAMKSFLLTRNPADRTMRGLALPQETAGDFRWQSSAVYNAVVALLAGLDEQDDL